MVSTRWFQGVENKSLYFEIRKKVFCDELKADENTLSDIYDQFAFNVVICDDNVPVGTGRLSFKDNKYFLDKICVIKEFRGNGYGELIVRMLVRKAVNIGAEKTYAAADKESKIIFEKAGFNEINTYDNGEVLMMKTGDVGGHCC